MLFAVKCVSKTLQKEDMHIDVAIDQLKGLITFLEKYRASGLAKAIDEAKEIASKMGVEPVRIHEKRVIRRKKQFDESVSEEVTFSAEESFRVNYFLYIMNQVVSSLTSRFEQFKKYQETWGFLFDVNILQLMNV